MKKLTIFCITILVIIPTVSVAFTVSPALKSEPKNYCKDPESWNEWNEIVAKYPADNDVQTLHALRLGLCLKIEQGSIKLKRAITLFNQAHEMVIQKKYYEFKGWKE